MRSADCAKAKQRAINEVNSLSYEVNSQKQKIGQLEENIYQRCRQIAIFQDKIDKTGRELIEERHRSNDFATSLASAEKNAALEVEYIKKNLRAAVCTFIVMIILHVIFV